MRPELFASDLDGTLLGGDGQLTDRTLHAMADVRDLGAQVVAVTGRSPITARPRLQPSIIETALCNNGAVQIDVASGEVIAAHYLDASTLNALFEQLRREFPDIAIAWEIDGGFGENRAFADLGLFLETSRSHRSIDGFPDPEALRTTKLAVAHRDHGPIELGELIDERIDTDLVMATSGAPFLEATAPGVHKGAALAAFCADRDIERTAVVSYGDNHNDVTMLEWAGLGVAVENAHPLATAAADETIGHHRDDSVALDMLARIR